MHDGYDASAPATYTLDVRGSQPLLGNDTWQVQVDPTGTPQAVAYTHVGALQNVTSVTWNDSGVAKVPGELTDPAVAVKTRPSHGTLVFQADGECTYTPNEGFTGTDGFTYEVPSLPNVPPAKVEIHVVPQGTPASFDWPEEPAPAMVQVPVGTTLNQPASAGLLADWNNNFAATYGPATVSVVEAPIYGSVIVQPDGSYAYSATRAGQSSKFADWDYFTVVLHRPGVQDSAPVTVAVEQTDSLPTAGQKSWSSLWTYARQPQAFDLRALFADSSHKMGDMSVSFPMGLRTEHGHLSQNPDKTYTYWPDDGFVGTDEMTYKGDDSVAELDYKAEQDDVLGSGYNHVGIDVRPLPVSLSLGSHPAGYPDAVVPLDKGTGFAANLVPLHLNIPAGLPLGTKIELSLNTTLDPAAASKVEVFSRANLFDPNAPLLGGSAGPTATWTMSGVLSGPPETVYVLGKQLSGPVEDEFDLKLTIGDDGGTDFFGNPAATSARTATPTTPFNTPTATAEQPFRVVGDGGYLVAFDGTWNDETDDTDGHKFLKYYDGTFRDYEPGVGTHQNILAKLFNGLTGFEAGFIVDNARRKIQTFYQAGHRDVPVDVIGYSRGSFQAVKFANWLVEDGFKVPDLDPKHQGKTITFHPRVRYIGVISPVGQMGELGTKLDFGWEKSLPSGVASAFVAWDNSPGRLDYPETHIDITRAAQYSSQQFDSTHEEIGYKESVMNALLFSASVAGVPIDWNP